MSAGSEPAGRGRRLSAALIDLVLVAAFGFVLLVLTGAFEDAEDYVGNPLPRIVALGFLSYFIVNGALLWWRSQTVGKALLGLVVVNAGTSTPAPLWRSLVRSPFFIALYGPFLLQLGIPALVDQLFIFGKKRRCLHDLICRTDVVRRRAALTTST